MHMLTSMQVQSHFYGDLSISYCKSAVLKMCLVRTSGVVIPGLELQPFC